MAQADANPTLEHPTLAIAQLRKDMQAAVDKLLAALDALDAPTEDLEDDDPGGGDVQDDRTTPWRRTPLRTAATRNRRLPFPADRPEPPARSTASTDDLEDEHDGAEPDEDGEPTLGSFNDLANQEHSWRQRDGAHVFYTDAEHDPAEQGEPEEWH